MVTEKQRTPLKTIAELYVECFTVIVFDQLNIYVRTASILYSELGAGTNCANKLHCGQEGKPRQHYVYTATIHVLWRSLLLDDKVRSVPHWICGTL